MSLYLVTGQSGTGKTSLLNEFKNRSIAAYGIDEDKVARHRFIETGEFLAEEDYKAGVNASFDWLHDIDYYIDPKIIQRLKDESVERNVFLFGGADDLSDYYHAFSKVFGLTIDEDTLVNRIKNRTGNSWGKKPHELKHILERREHTENELRDIGAVMIDASLPLTEVADSILSYID